MATKSISQFTLSILLITATDTAAQDWPQWRGPNRDGVVSSFSQPDSWPEQLKLEWRGTVGQGHASPVVAGGKVYQFSRQGEQEAVTCLDLDSGRSRWQQRYPAPYRMNPAARSHGSGPKSTPVVSDGKIFTFGISGTLSCFDAETGEIVWTKDFEDQYAETSPLYGTAMSPLVADGLLIAHVGGHGGGALTAFDADSGEVRWEWDGDGPGYASPIIAELGGTRQLVTQTQEHIVGVGVESGELLWEIPFTTAYVQNIVTPVLHGQDLIFSGLDKGIVAIRVSRNNGEWTTEKVWETKELSMYMSSPVLKGDVLFGLSQFRRGQFFALDARTGSALWTSEGRQGRNASVSIAGEVLFFLTNEAELTVAKATKEGFEPIRQYSVAESPTWAHLVVVGNRMLVKDDSTLSLWALE
jgi:outer membrane protein assembly factor BamB